MSMLYRESSRAMTAVLLSCRSPLSSKVRTFHEARMKHTGIIQFRRPPLAPRGVQMLRDAEFAITRNKVISQLTWFFH